MKSILVTGGAGFIGSNYLKMKVKHTNATIVNLDALTYAGNLHNLDEIREKHIFVEGDICNKKLVEQLFEQYGFDTVINFAAESHVDRSIKNPDIFINTNVKGTQTLLDVCKSYWLEESKDSFIYKENVKYLQVSTDEVYGTLSENGKFTEETPISPNSPYSASKASADLFVRAYHKTYNFPSLITRCSNNYGPNQFPEKLIPLTIMKALSNSEIPIYGNGLQIRDWIYVEDHCLGIDAVLNKGAIGEVYNIGCETNVDIVRLILKELDKPESLITHVKDRPGHDTRYAIDNSKITKNIGWKPNYQFEKGIKHTIEWYLNNDKWIEDIKSGNYLKYRY